MEAFEADGVLEDMDIEMPKEQLSVEYDSVEVIPGKVMTPTQVKDPPQCNWKADSSSFYIILMHDLDGPSRKDPRYREWHHWYVGNIPGKDIAKGEVLSAYIGAGPPKGTGQHRYVILVFKQPEKLVFKEERLPNNSGADRRSHKAVDIAKKYKMGAPVAGSFFQAEHDDYVRELYKQLSG